MKRLISASFALVALSACGQTPTTPSAPSEANDLVSLEQQMDLAWATLEAGTPGLSEKIQKLGFKSIKDMPENVMFFQTPSGVKTMNLSGGIG